MIASLEKGHFLKLFNRGGYVLDFSTADFDAFTMQSIGIPLCEKYGLSKGKSLIAFVNEASNEDARRLLVDLLDYYEAYYGDEYDDSCRDSSRQYGHDWNNKSLYLKCKTIADREKGAADFLAGSASYLKESFSSEYMNEQIDLLMKMRVEHPTDAIGKAKDLIESCCKTILEAQGISWGRDWSVARFAKETSKLLGASAECVSNEASESAIVKKILGSLQGLAAGVSEFRNAYGTGHGGEASFQNLPARHAKLAAGSSVTLVEYYWETYEWKKKLGALK